MLPIPRGWGSSVPNILGPYLCPYGLTYCDQIWLINTWGRDVFVGGQPHAPSQGAVSQCPQRFWDHYSHAFWHRATNFGTITRGQRAYFSMVMHDSYPKEQGPSTSIFLGPATYIHTI